MQCIKIITLDLKSPQLYIIKILNNFTSPKRRKNIRMKIINTRKDSIGFSDYCVHKPVKEFYGGLTYPGKQQN